MFSDPKVSENYACVRRSEMIAIRHPTRWPAIYPAGSCSRTKDIPMKRIHPFLRIPSRSLLLVAVLAAGLLPFGARAQIQISRDSNSVVITWDPANATLQQADASGGPWQPVTGAASP